MMKKIGIGIIAVIAIVLSYAATKPDTFQVERSITIKAPPEAIHAYLIDFRKWQAWSPWEKMDPAMKRTYSGPTSGKGAAYEWEGSSAVGQGRMEVTDVLPSRVTVQLDFVAPMEARSSVDFTLTSQDDATKVVWTMSGDNNYLAKLMQVFMSMDSMVGKDFESGLADLKTAAEQAAAMPPSTLAQP